MSDQLAAERPIQNKAAEAAVLTKAVMRTAEFLGINNAALAKILGTSEATVSRMARGEYRLKPGAKETELAILLVRLYRGLDSIVGGDVEAARSWLRGHNTALRAVPLDAIKTVQGLANAVSYVDSRRARI